MPAGIFFCGKKRFPAATPQAPSGYLVLAIERKGYPRRKRKHPPERISPGKLWPDESFCAGND